MFHNKFSESFAWHVAYWLDADMISKGGLGISYFGSATTGIGADRTGMYPELDCTRMLVFWVPSEHYYSLEAGPNPARQPEVHVLKYIIAVRPMHASCRSCTCKIFAIRSSDKGFERHLS